MMFSKHGEKEAAVCLLFVILVDDENEKILVQLELQAWIYFKVSEVSTEIENVVPTVWRNIASRTNASILLKKMKMLANIFNMFKNVGELFFR